MKLVGISDPHLSWDVPEARLDDCVRTQFKKLRYVLSYCMKEKARLLVSGDLFNSPRSWYLLPYTMRVLEDFYSDVPMHAVFGQHDTYMYNEETRKNTNLGVLEQAKIFNILDSEPYDLGQVHLYGASFGQPVPEVKDKSATNVLVIHDSIYVSPLFPGHSYKDATRFINRHEDFQFIHCGDIHRKFEAESDDGRLIVNTGPMVRRTAESYNFEHEPCFFVFDTYTGDLTWEVIPHQPASEVLSREHLDRVTEAKGFLDEFIDSIETEELDSVSYVENLWEFIGKNDIESDVVDIITLCVEESTNAQS